MNSITLEPCRLGFIRKKNRIKFCRQNISETIEARALKVNEWIGNDE